MKELTVLEAIDFIDCICCHLGHDFFDDPVFPDGHRDMCVVRYLTDNGDYGFDTIYLVWKKMDGIHYKEVIDYFIWKEPDGIHYKKIVSSRLTKNLDLHIDSVEINEDGSISVKYSSTLWHDQERVN